MTYLFVCNHCGYNFEINASPSTIVGLKTFCPHCCSTDISRKYTVPHFVLSGKGFYSTDNKKKENKE